ncbi:MAG: hypothetical protein JSW47_03925, partial [Phycisphaerales bacterium]
EALTYRLQRGLDREDEQMALLVQRVSGSHRNGYFFQDLVETDIFYVALFPNRNSVVFNKDLLLNRPNLLCELRPEASKYESIVHVCEIGPGQLQIFADLLSRKVLCYLA